MIDASIMAAAEYEKGNSKYKDRFGKVYADPRPDIDGDARLWVTLFLEADRVSYKLSDALFGLRCVGARLEKTDTGHVLRPVIDETGNCGFKDWSEYRCQADKWLKPFLGPLKGLMRDLEAKTKEWWGDQP